MTMASPSPPRDSLTETMTSLFDYLKADEMTLTKEDQGYYYKTLDEKVAPETRGHLKKLLDINKRYALRMEQSEEKAKAAHAQNEHHTAAMVTTSSMAAGLETDEVLRRISGGTVGGAMTSGAAINRSMTTRTEGGGERGGGERGAGRGRFGPGARRRGHGHQEEEDKEGVHSALRGRDGGGRFDLPVGVHRRHIRDARRLHRGAHVPVADEDGR